MGALAKFGRAAIGWTSTEDANSERVHLLDAPLRDFRAAHVLSAYRAESLDKSAVATVHVGNGAYDLIGEVRYEGHSQTLIDLIKAGSQGKTLTYYPSLDDPDASHACILVGPLSPTELAQDAQRGALGDQSVTLRLRRTDEAPFPTLMQGTNVLFAYRAGDSLAQATFSRADTASYVAKGLGTLSSAASGIARLTWISTAGSTGVRNTPALLLERAQTNRVPWSEKFSTWTNASTAAPGLSSGQADPRGGTAAWLLSDNSTVAISGKILTVTLSAATRAGMSIFMRQGTTAAAAGVVFKLRETGVADRGRANVTWSSGKPTVTVTVGTTWLAPEAYRGGWWRITLRTTTATSTGAGANTAQIYPANDGTVTHRGNVYVYGVQVE